MNVVESHHRRSVMSVLGTRPEAIKLAPVIRELERRHGEFRTINVITSQHTDLLRPFIELFGIRTDHDLGAMQHGQGLNQLLARVIAALDPIMVRESPDVVVVQGDTTTALAGALVAFHHRIPVAHVEAGLRSLNAFSPFPEEMNRRIVSRLTSCHFAPTRRNVELLLREGIEPESIVQSGNPVVDAVKWIVANKRPSPDVVKLLKELQGLKLILLTTHRRESFGDVMLGHLEAIRHFVERHPDVALIFPVHANPTVREAAFSTLKDVPRVRLVLPLGYADFIHVMAASTMIVSDSGGVQEEVPSLGKALLILRENTERPEAVECGVARLVGNSSQRLAELLEEAFAPNSWINDVTHVENPFGQGDTAIRIVDGISRLLSGGGLAGLSDAEAFPSVLRP